MHPMNCCPCPSLDPGSIELGHADSFDFDLATCAHCGAYWMRVFCVASGIAGLEPVTPVDAATMLAAEPGRSRKACLRDWADRLL